MKLFLASLRKHLKSSQKTECVIRLDMDGWCGARRFCVVELKR